MNQKSKFSYEDAVEYVLGRLSDEEKKIFEKQLETDPELRELVSLANSNKESILKLDKFELKEDFLSLLLKKAKNILGESEVKRGRVFKLDQQDLQYEKRELLEDLYFLVLTNPEASLTGNDVRVIPLSTFTQYVQVYDLVFTEKLISTKQLGVVAHIHLSTNIMVDQLKHFIGELDPKNFEAIVHADLNDYSMVDQNTILTGSEYRKRFPIDPYFDEEFEAWYSVLKDFLDEFRIKTLEFAEEMVDETDKPYSPDLFFPDLSFQEKITDELQTDNIKFLWSTHYKLYPVKYKYKFDEEDFLIFEDKKNILTNKYKLEVRKKSLKLRELNYDKVKDKLYQNINDEKKGHMKEGLFKVYNLKEYSDYVHKHSKLKLAAKQYEFLNIPENSLLLYEDQRLLIYFSFYDNRLFLEINFLEKREIEFIENFHFAFLSDNTGFFISSIKVNLSQVRIPFDFSREQIENLQEGFIVGFVFNNTSFIVKLKLLLH